MMTGYLLVVYVHLLAAVLWVGYILFWALILRRPSRGLDALRSAIFIRLLHRTPWPPTSLPVPYRVRFPGLGWGALAVLGATGLFMLYAQGGIAQRPIARELLFSPYGRTLSVKLIMVVALAACQLVLIKKPTQRWAHLGLIATVFIIALSALLARGG